MSAATEKIKPTPEMFTWLDEHAKEAFAETMQAFITRFKLTNDEFFEVLQAWSKARREKR